MINYAAHAALAASHWPLYETVLTDTATKTIDAKNVVASLKIVRKSRRGG